MCRCGRLTKSKAGGLPNTIIEMFRYTIQYIFVEVFCVYKCSCVVDVVGFSFFLLPLSLLVYVCR